MRHHTKNIIKTVLVALTTLLLTATTILTQTTNAKAADEYTGTLNVALIANYADGSAAGDRDHLNAVAGPATGNANPSTPTGNNPGFNYTLVCTTPSGASCYNAAGTLRIQWDFSGGKNPEPAILATSINDGTTARRAWATPGTYPVSVTVDQVYNATNNQGENAAYRTGTASVTTYVAQNYQDIQPSNLNHKADTSYANWAAIATGLMGPCRNWVPSSGGTDAGTGSEEFCGETNAQRSAVSDNGGLLANPVTGIACLADQTACDLTADAKARTSAGNPTGSCSVGTECFDYLVGAGLIAADGSAQINPNVCTDNVTAKRDDAVIGGTAVVRGVEPGCATLHDAYASLVAAHDTKAPGETPDSTNVYLPLANRAGSNILTNQNTAGASWTTTGGTTTTTGGSLAVNGTNTVLTHTPTDITSGNPYGRNYTAAVKIKADHGGLATLTVTWKNGTTTLSNTSKTTQLTDTNTLLRSEMFAPPGATSAVWSLTSNGVGVTTLTDATFAYGSQPGTLTNATPNSVCANGPEPDATDKRAYALYGNIISNCNTDRALTKRDWYGLLAAVTNSTPDDNLTAKNLRDLVNPTLASSTSSNTAVTNLRATIGGLLNKGIPLVGNLRCPGTDPATYGSSGGVCLNPDSAMTRTDLARTLTAAFAQSAGSANLTLDTFASKQSVGLGNTTTITAVATVPAYVPVGSTIAFTGQGASIKCPVTTAAVGADHTARITCTWTATRGEDGDIVDLNITAAFEGSTATSLTRIEVKNHPPVFGQPIAPSSQPTEGGGPYTIKIPYHDEDGNTITSNATNNTIINRAGVRSCDPANETCPTTGVTFPQTGQSRVITSDNAPGGFTDQATTEVGTVTLDANAPNQDKYVTVILTLANNNVNGNYSFVVQGCDFGGACTKRQVGVSGNQFSVTAVNDLPVADTLTVTTPSPNVAVRIPFGGNDNADKITGGRTPQITNFRINSLPAAGVDGGTLTCQSVSNTAACPSGTPAPITNTPVTVPANANVMWTPALNKDPNNNTLTYAVQDDDNPTGSWSAGQTLVSLYNPQPDPPPTAVLSLTPAGGALKVNGGGAGKISTTYPIPSTNTEQYQQLSAWVKGPAGNYRITTSQHNPNDDTDTQNGTWVTVPANTWTRVTAVRTSAANESKVNFSVETSNNGNTFYMDDALAQLSVSTTDTALVAPQVNLIANGGVDGDTTGWDTATGTFTAVTGVDGNNVPYYHAATVPAWSTQVVANATGSTDLGSKYTIGSYAFNFGESAGGNITQSVAPYRYKNIFDTVYPVSVTVTDTFPGTPHTATAYGAVNSTRNFVSNPDMNAGVNQWLGVNGSTLTTTAGQTTTYGMNNPYPPATGTLTVTNPNALKVTGTASSCTVTPSTFVISSASPTAPGIHKVSGWVKNDTKNTGRQIQITAQVFDASDNLTGSNTYTTTVAPDGWTQINTSIAINNFDDKLKVTFNAANPIGAGACFSLDDVAVYKP